MRFRHSSFTDRTNRSAWALQFGARGVSELRERRPWQVTAPPRHSTSDWVSHFNEASALAVVETRALPSAPGLQQSILFAQERDDLGLLTLEPSAQRGDQQLKRERGRSLRQRRAIGGTLRTQPPFAVQQNAVSVSLADLLPDAKWDPSS